MWRFSEDFGICSYRSMDVSFIWILEFPRVIIGFSLEKEIVNLIEKLSRKLEDLSVIWE